MRQAAGYLSLSLYSLSLGVWRVMCFSNTLIRPSRAQPGVFSHGIELERDKDTKTSARWVTYVHSSYFVCILQWIFIKLGRKCI